MTVPPNHHLHEELVLLLEVATSMPSGEVVAYAIEHIERLPDAERRAEIGGQLLRHIAAGQDPNAAAAAKALQVMEHFPHFARPRAAVALAALQGFCSQKAA